jgi:lipoate-protein ligase B
MKFWSIQGTVSYQDARQLQLRLVELRHQELISDVVLFLEHRPVITQGRGLQFTGKPRDRHMPVPASLPSSISFEESERGGDLTYHGPGQLVIYPICKLDGRGFGPHHDVTAYLRRLEEVMISTLADYGLTGNSEVNATGIWIHEAESKLKKLGSIGIAVRKWVTYHGVALNCVNDLSPFHLISPCGYSPDVMTRLADHVPLADQWRPLLELRIAAHMSRAAGHEGDDLDPERLVSRFDLSEAVARGQSLS